MKPRLPNTISDGIPNFYRVRGGTLLESLLQRIDQNWQRLGPIWLDLLSHSSCEAVSREIVDATGWSHIVMLANSRIANPKMLAEVTSSGGPGSERSIRFWLKCLFDWDVESVVIERIVWAAASPKVVVRLTKLCPATDLDLAIEVLRAICPAHLEVNESSLVWIHENGAK